MGILADKMLQEGDDTVGIFAASQWLRDDVVDVYGACEDVPVIE